VAGNAATISNEQKFLQFFRTEGGATHWAGAGRTMAWLKRWRSPKHGGHGGQEASFLAGGEYPYPTVQGTAARRLQCRFQFKEYGVGSTFIPTITPARNHRCKWRPEVSSLDFSNAIQISGFNVPALPPVNEDRKSNWRRRNLVMRLSG